MPFFRITFHGNSHEPGLIEAENEDDAVVQATIITRCRVHEAEPAPMLKLNAQPPQECRDRDSCTGLTGCPFAGGCPAPMPF